MTAFQILYLLQPFPPVFWILWFQILRTGQVLISLKDKYLVARLDELHLEKRPWWAGNTAQSVEGLPSVKEILGWTPACINWGMILGRWRCQKFKVICSYTEMLKLPCVCVCLRRARNRFMVWSYYGKVSLSIWLLCSLHVDQADHTPIKVHLPLPVHPDAYLWKEFLAFSTLAVQCSSM